MSKNVSVTIALMLALVLASGVGCGGSSPAEQETTPARSGRRQGRPSRHSADEAAGLVARGQDLARHGECASAIPQAFEPAIAIYRDVYPSTQRFVFGRTSTTLASAVRSAGMSHVIRGDAPTGDIVPVLDAGYAEALYGIAFCSIELGRPLDAINALETSLRIMPGDFVSLSELGHVYQGMLRFDEALAIFRAAYENVQLYLTSPGASLSNVVLDQTLAFWSARTRRGMGFSLIELRRFDEAEAIYRQILSDFPDDRQAATELQYIAQARRASPR